MYMFLWYIVTCKTYLMISIVTLDTAPATIIRDEGLGSKARARLCKIQFVYWAQPELKLWTL